MILLNESLNQFLSSYQEMKIDFSKLLFSQEGFLQFLKETKLIDGVGIHHKSHLLSGDKSKAVLVVENNDKFQKYSSSSEGKEQSIRAFTRASGYIPALNKCLETAVKNHYKINNVIHSIDKVGVSESTSNDFMVVQTVNRKKALLKNYYCH
jgi:hypothetical protein